MKQIIITLLICSFLLCGCVNVINVDNDTTTEPSVQNTTVANEETIPNPTFDWELPIDVDESVTEPVVEDTTIGNSDIPEDTTFGNQTETVSPTEPQVTEDDPAVNVTTSDPEVESTTEPETTEQPEETEPQTTKAPSNDGPIELPLIPG